MESNSRRRRQECVCCKKLQNGDAGNSTKTHFQRNEPSCLGNKGTPRVTRTLPPTIISSVEKKTRGYFNFYFSNNNKNVGHQFPLNL